MSADNTTAEESSTDDEENNSSAPLTPHYEHSHASPAQRREPLGLQHIPYEIPQRCRKGEMRKTFLQFFR